VRGFGLKHFMVDISLLKGYNLIMDKQIKRFAFIDVCNTTNTTEKLHNFVIDWHKLMDFLKEQWNCEKVFFYAGIEIGDTNMEQEYLELKKIGYEMRTKPTMSYKRRPKTVSMACSECGELNTRNIPMGYEKKSNCDSELTVDAIDFAESGMEMCIFTGDGDFKYLIERLVAKGVSIKVVSSNAEQPSPVKSRRLSSRLKELFRKPEVNLIEINDLKERIEKTIESSEG